MAGSLAETHMAAAEGAVCGGVGGGPGAPAKLSAIN